jgi:hypothetical protein
VSTHPAILVDRVQWQHSGKLFMHQISCGDVVVASTACARVCIRLALSKAAEWCRVSVVLFHHQVTSSSSSSSSSTEVVPGRSGP